MHNLAGFGHHQVLIFGDYTKMMTAFLKAYASGMISLPEGMLQEGNTENEETEGYEDEA